MISLCSTTNLKDKDIDVLVTVLIEKVLLNSELLKQQYWDDKESNIPEE